MEPQTNFNTPEFWITAVTNIVLAVIEVLVGYNVLTMEQAQLWILLAQALILAVIPVVMMLVTTVYVKSRAEVKTAMIMRGIQ